MLTSQNPDPNARRTFVLFRPFVTVWHWLFPPTQAHQDRQSSSSRWIAGIAVVAFFVGIAALAVIYARPIYRGYKTFQAERKISKAVELEKQERFSEAGRMAYEAYVLDPDNPTVLRTLARYYTARGQNKEAFYLLDKLQRLGVPETDDDRLLRIQALANSNEIKDAQVRIEELLRTSPPSARMVEIADTVLQRRGRTRQLIEILRTYVALKPEDLDIKLRLGTREVQ
jgi:tetratricopeptide (TPR) repeat protein